MGSLERRLARLEAHLGGLWDTNPLEEQIASEAMSRLSEPDLKRIVVGLERVGETTAGMPPNSPIPREVYEEILSQEELAALEYLLELEAELREAG